MAGDNRVTRTRRHAYRTLSNRVKTIRTPGGRHAAQFLDKTRKGTSCGECGCTLPGIKRMTTSEFHSAKKREKTVSRAYGGTKCANCTKSRIVRAFLIEEQKIVKKVLAAAKKPAAEKPVEEKKPKEESKKSSKK